MDLAKTKFFGCIHTQVLRYILGVLVKNFFHTMSQSFMQTILKDISYVNFTKLIEAYLCVIAQSSWFNASSTLKKFNEQAVAIKLNLIKLASLFTALLIYYLCVYYDYKRKLNILCRIKLLLLKTENFLNKLRNIYFSNLFLSLPIFTRPIFLQHESI